MDIQFLISVLQVPTVSDHEEMMQDFVQDWCKKNGVKCSKDGKGNLYLTRGKPKNGEFYVGATAHLDTVQHEQLDYIKEKKLLEPKVENGKITMWMGDKQTGTGSDDKNAIAIILSMMKRVKKPMKAAFYVGEEIGMAGVKASDFGFWDDVSWIFGCDSPGPASRATKSCSGVRLYSDEFFDEYLEKTCAKFGKTDFRFEPYSDIQQLRQKTKLETTNFSNGGYSAHSSSEYAVFSEVVDTEDLGCALAESIPTDVRHTSEVKNAYSGGGWSSYSSYSPSYSGSWRSPYSPRGSSLRQGAFSFGSPSPRSDEKGSFVYAFTEKKARDEFVEKYMELPNVAKYLKREDVGVQSVRVSGERLYCRFAWLDAYNRDTDSSWKTWSEFETGEPMAAREFERAFRPDEDEEEPAPEGLEGEAAYEFSNRAAMDAFLQKLAKDSGEVEGAAVPGRNAVMMNGTRLALAKAWISAVAFDLGEPSLLKFAEQSEGGWTAFSGKRPREAAAFEAAFKPSEKAAAEPEDIGDGADVAVFVQADDPDDQAVIQDRILDKNIAVDIDFDPEGLFLTGLMKDVAEAWTVAKNVLDGTSYRSFRALSAADRLSAAEFFDAVDDASGRGEPIDVEFSDDEDGEDGSFDALDLIRPPKK